MHEVAVEDNDVSFVLVSYAGHLARPYMYEWLPYRRQVSTDNTTWLLDNQEIPEIALGTSRHADNLSHAIFNLSRQ